MNTSKTMKFILKEELFFLDLLVILWHTSNQITEFNTVSDFQHSR
jgi:hypothetical protein